MKNDILGFHGEHRWLSNFVPVEIEFNNIVFPSVEHAYVASKTQNMYRQLEVSKIPNAGEVKKFGRTLELRPNWDTFRLVNMRVFLEQKFAQEPFLTKLLATGKVYIEETNMWNDTFWGVCAKTGYGKNNLGILIMHIRGNLEKQKQLTLLSTTG